MSMNIFGKLKFLWKKPKVIVVRGNYCREAKEVISQILKPHFKIGNEILLFETDLKNSPGGEKFKFLIEKSSLPILVITHLGHLPPDQVSFAKDREKTLEIKKLAKILPNYGYLISNFDDEKIREVKAESRALNLTFGFQPGADFQATDIKINREINFKINYKGNIVPFWLTVSNGLEVKKERIYPILAAVSVGTIFNLNLVEISQTLKSLRQYSTLGVE